MKELIIILNLFLSVTLVDAQNQIQFLVNDATENETLIGVNVLIKGTDNGAVTNLYGLATLKDIPNGTNNFVFSYIGFETQTITLNFPTEETSITINLREDESSLDEVVITSNRANRSIANIPTRIEALTDEVEEAATMDPSKIAHLLMHTTGVQVQQNSATSGSASVRIQGQYGRYTQILKDGFPIYGGFTGGLSVLQIPPLDLRQVEFIKGSASTLYGGGAIAGLINLISKEPKNEEEVSLHLNISHIGGADLNSFFSKKIGKWGMTVFASNNTNRYYDVDDDGFSDVPEVRKFNFNPKVFYYLNNKTTISLGGTFTNENRIGGDTKLIEGTTISGTNNYFERNKSQQVSTLFKVETDLGDKGNIEIKNSTSRFKRNIYLNNYSFAGTQFSTFSEVSHLLEKPKHSLVTGINAYTDNFKETAISDITLRNQQLVTFGLFAQHIWDIHKKLAVESGFRLDYNTDYGVFPLPKMALIYKPIHRFTARLGAGMGYKLPTIFTEDAEGLAFENIVGINQDINEAEKSIGINADFTAKIMETGQVNITLSELLFYNRLNNPLILTADAASIYTQFENSNGYFDTRGIETTLKASVGNFNLYIGYTFVDAKGNNGIETTALPLTPKHAIHADCMFIQEGKWRVGLDAEYESKQTLNSGRQVRALFKAGFLAERTFNNISIYINLENFTDTRQSRYEDTVQAPNTDPRFTEVWAPMEGFIFNTGVKVKL